jgi:hypothetical protein
MFGIPGRRDSMPMGGPPRDFPQQFGKLHAMLSIFHGLINGQIHAWEPSLLDTTLSGVISLMPAPFPGRIFRTFMPASAINHRVAQMRPNK